MATFDVYKAILHLRSHAHAKSLHKCATYVKQALAAGGLPYKSGSNGVDVGPHYEREYGFKRVNVKQNGKNFVGMVAGDICSISVKHHNLGHACMYDGYQWISDFKQANAIPYSLETVNWARVWRWKDIPGDFNVPPDDKSPTSFNGNFSSSNTGNAGPSLVIIVENQYPTHSEYVTYAGSGGNIFENAKKNSLTFIQGSYSSDNEIDKQKNEKHTRIYSTNDAVIVLDELHLPLDDNNITYANKGITDEDVNKHTAKLKKDEEEAKKKQEANNTSTENNSSTGTNTSTNINETK